MATKPLPHMPKPAPVPSPSPPQSYPADEPLHHSIKNLHLWTRSQEFRSRKGQCDASSQAEKKSRKQVQFNVDKELGDEPSLPMDLTHFLAEGATSEQRSITSSPAQLLAPTRNPSPAMPNMRGLA